MPPDRPKQLLPDDLVTNCLTFIRNQFYEGDTKQFFQDRRFLMRVVTYPAKWLNDRSVQLLPARYQEVLFNIFKDVQHHGATGAIKYWPGYLLHCVQEHFKCHGDEYYQEAKAIRTQAEHVLLGLLKSTTTAPRPDNTTATLAQLHRVLSVKRPKKSQPAKQLSLF